MIQKEIYCSLSQAIVNLKPGAVFNTSENNYESIEVAEAVKTLNLKYVVFCLLYTSPSPRDS